MAGPDYTFIFGDFTDNLASGSMVDHQGGSTARFYVSIDDCQLAAARGGSIPSQVADLIDLAAAVYFADRFSIRHQGMTCEVEVELPLRHPEVLRRNGIADRLEHVLTWYTGDHWHFDFVRRSAPGRASECQLGLELQYRGGQAVEVALWSGGLDALAGLENRLRTNPNGQFMLVGAGGNPFIQGVQKGVAQEVSARHRGHVGLLQIPVRSAGTASMPKHSQLRSRGFVFLLIGLAAAYAVGERQLRVYENGIGAINLPFRASEVGLDHARSVHPLSLLRVADFVSAVLEVPVFAENPFLLTTKAEMCQVLADKEWKLVIPQTVSCDSRRREAEKPVQCGCCSSCLLRKQALAAQKIEDRTEYVVPLNRPARPEESNHLRAMLCQVEQLRQVLNGPSPWLELIREHPTLCEIVDQGSAQADLAPEMMQDGLLRLFHSYISEWDRARATVAEGLL
jgi:7-cyano-7-deazaguanine synthase in queuosine biosynthesis